VGGLRAQGRPGGAGGELSARFSEGGVDYHPAAASQDRANDAGPTASAWKLSCLCRSGQPSPQPNSLSPEFTQPRIHLAPNPLSDAAGPVDQLDALGFEAVADPVGFCEVAGGLAAILGLFTFLLQGAPSVMIPQLMTTYGIDVIQIGVLTSSFFYTYILMQVPAGMLVDLWGPRRVTKVSFLLCSIAIGWFAFSTHFWEGQVSRMMMGLTASPAFICAICLGARWFKPHLFTLIVALTEFLVLLGGVIGEGGLAKVVVAFGWKETMVILAFTGLLLTFLSLIFIHDYPDHDQQLHNGKTFKESFKNTMKNFIRILSIRPLWINGLYAGLVFGTFPAFAALWGIPYFIKRYAVTVDIAALIASTFFFGACFGTLILGWTSIYITRRRPIMIWGAFISFLLSLCGIFIPQVSLSMMFVLMFVFGFFSSAYTLAFALVGSHVTPQTKGVAIGFTNMLCIIFGAPVLQPLIGALLTWSTDTAINGKLKAYNMHDYTIALSPLPLCLLIAFILAFFIKENAKTAESTH